MNTTKLFLPIIVASRSSACRLRQMRRRTHHCCCWSMSSRRTPPPPDKKLTAMIRLLTSMTSKSSRGQHRSSTTAGTTSVDNGGLLHSSSSCSSSSSAVPPEKIPRPSARSLRALFTASAIPMVGFGFMDNLVMIQAGQYIDSTIGVSLGLATMTAAAAGQVVSDTTGVLFGGTLERFLMNLSLIENPNLTTAQRSLSLCRNVKMAGAVVGVICGCTLGASTLLLVDLEARERIERSTKLREIVTDMIEEEEDGTGDGLFPCEMCTVYFGTTSAGGFTISPPSSDGGSVEQQRQKRKTVHLRLMQDADSSLDAPLVQQCVDSSAPTLDEKRQLLCVPVIHKRGTTTTGTDSSRDEHDVMAVVAFRFPAGTSSVAAARDDGFSAKDVHTAQVIARHLAIFIERLVEK